LDGRLAGMSPIGTAVVLRDGMLAGARIVLTDELISLVLSAANVLWAVALVPPVLRLLAAVIALARLLLPILGALCDLLPAPVGIAPLGTRLLPILTRLLALGLAAALPRVLALIVAGVRQRGRKQEDQPGQAAVG
jgi:hypothetical protein